MLSVLGVGEASLVFAIGGRVKEGVVILLLRGRPCCSYFFCRRAYRGRWTLASLLFRNG